MKIVKEISKKEEVCMWCREKIAKNEECYKVNNDSYLCKDDGIAFIKMLKDKQTKITDFTEQKKLDDYHFVYNKPVEKFSKLKEVYKHNKDFSKRIEIEREM